MPLDTEVLLFKGQGLACGNLELKTHQIHAGNAFGDRVFHLQSGVHFQEIKLVVTVQQKLNSPRVLVLTCLGDSDRGLPHGLSKSGGEAGGGGFFDELLVPSLDRTFPFKKVDGASRGIGQDLNFDVAGVFKVLFDENRTIAKGASGFGNGGAERFFEVLCAMHNPHSFAATAGSGFDKEGKANLLGNAKGLCGVGNRVIGSGHQGDLKAGYGLFGGYLVAHGPDALRGRSNQNQTSLFDGLGKVGVFGKKTVSRVDGLATLFQGQGNQGLTTQVGSGRGGGAQTIG